MKNLFIPIIFMALTLGFGCKNIFQEKSIVGQWKEIRTYRPSQGKWQKYGQPDDFIEFFANGDVGFRGFSGYSVCCTYTIDDKADPNRIMITNKKDNSQQIWIYKFEGKKLIIKIPKGDNKRAATNFDIEPEFEIMENQMNK